MAVSYGHLGDDAHYLDETARLFGWHTAWDPDHRAARMTYGPWEARLLFGPLGGFHGAVVRDAAGSELELGLAQVVGLLEREGRATRRPVA